MLAHEQSLFDMVAIDVIGVGAGVYDLIKAKGIPCLDVNVGRQSTQPTKFQRLRDELWWSLRLWFEDGKATISQTIPQKHRDAFIADIQDIHFDFVPSGARKIEDKDHMKARLKFSPDLGDAVCLTFASGGFFNGCYFD